MAKLIFVVDCTRSMGALLDSIHVVIQQVCCLSQLLMQGQLKLAVMVYGDYDCNDDVVTLSDFTSDVQQLCKFIQREVVVKSNGDDIPEAQHTAFWTLLPYLDDSTIVIHYTDSPPHHPSNWQEDSACQCHQQELSFLQSLHAPTKWDDLCDSVKNSGCHLYTLTNTFFTDVVNFYKQLGTVILLHGNHADNVLDVTFTLIQQLTGIIPCSGAISTLQCNPKVLPIVFRSSPVYQRLCLQLYHILLSDINLVMALTCHSIFGTLWRQICRCRDELKREVLVKKLGLCCGKLSPNHELKLRQWIENSYDATDKIEELIQSAPPTTEYISIKEGYTVIKSVLMSFIRGAYNQQVVSLLQQALSTCMVTSTPGIPLSLSPESFFSVLPSLLCKGVRFSSIRPSIILAVVCLRIPALALMAERLLLQWRGRWINLQLEENYSGCFVDLISRLIDTHFLTHEEKQVYHKLFILFQLARNRDRCFSDFNIPLSHLLYENPQLLGLFGFSMSLPPNIIANVLCSNLTLIQRYQQFESIMTYQKLQPDLSTLHHNGQPIPHADTVIQQLQHDLMYNVPST